MAALPSTSNYHLNSFGFGSGGTAGSSTSNYKVEGITGEISGSSPATSNYYLKPGFIQTQQANVPTAPSLTNPSNYYDKLKLVIATAGNPTDAKYAISISSDNFASDKRYVKADHTVGSSLAVGDYQTYASWGSGSGFLIIGLLPSTTYTVKVKATQGTYTESAYGPTAQAATVNQQLSFSVSPNSEDLGALLAGTVISSPSNVTASIGTNADAGANIYITGQNGGLKSNTTGTLISSSTADLSSASTGFGVQSTGVTQSGGGPLAVVSPYNGAGSNVGITDQTLRQIYTTTGPITGGQGTLVIKAKSSSTTPSANDYAEVLTLIAAAIY